jgi:hypothetical protein
MVKKPTTSSIKLLRNYILKGATAENINTFIESGGCEILTSKINEIDDISNNKHKNIELIKTAIILL